MTPELCYLDFEKEGFSTKSEDVKAARERHWCARTPYGYAVLSHHHVGHLLRDKRLRQGSYAWPEKQQATGSFAEFWQRSIISQEGAHHKRLRLLATKALSEDFVLTLVPQFNAIAQDLCIPLATKRECEFQSEFAMPFAGQAICVLLDLPRSEWRPVATWASTLGLAMGLEYQKHQDKINAACDALSALADQLIRRAQSNATASDLVRRLIVLHRDFPDISHQNLIDLIVIMIFGGVDTTRSQLGFLMALFDRNPDQWVLLKQNPTLAKSAIEEAIRAWPTTTWATREATQDFEYEGVAFKRSQTVHLLVHSSAKDSVLGDLPEFDIRLRQKRHHGFGGGAHHCLGHFVARTDMRCALSALSDAIDSFSVTDGAIYLPDRGNTSPEYLPLRYTANSHLMA